MTDLHKSPSSVSVRRRTAAIVLFVGLAILVVGCFLETRHPRTNIEDNSAWLVLGAGVSLVAFGVSLWFVRPLMALLISISAPPVAFCLSVAIYWACFIANGYQKHDHQDFAANGVAQIAPAAQMGEVFPDCRHYITYGPHSVPLFTSVAYFGDRYELTMQVAIEIESASSGSVIGKPSFYLNEISAISISPTGQIEASYSRNLNFGPEEWAQVYNSDGDFGEIGFVVNPKPVPNFVTYTDASRPSN